MNTKNFLLIGLILVFSSVFAQSQQQQQQQQQGATLTREAVEKLLEVLSFECRSEMEAALSEQTDVSMECKQEITQAIRDHNIPIQQGNPPPPQSQEAQDDSADENFEQQAKAQPQSEGLKVKKGAEGISPIYSILAFVVVFFGAAIAYIVQVNKARGPAIAQKPKKLSKKKEEKLKIKKQNLEKLN